VEQAMENTIVRSCPECRIHSDFIVPSSTWVEEPEDREKLVSAYRANMKSKQCKYMKSGDVNECPFGNKCFYKHQLPNGEIVEGESPHELRRRKRYQLDLHQMIFGDEDDEATEDLMEEVIQQMVQNARATSS